MSNQRPDGITPSQTVGPYFKYGLTPNGEYAWNDAFSNNLRVTLVEDGCFDRSQASHAINLCDMNAKYADVMKSDEVLAFIESLPTGMFDLPSGPPQLAAVVNR